MAFRVELLERTTGHRGIDQPQHTGFLPDVFDTREAAVAAIEDHIADYHESGYSPEDDGWWYRNKGCAMTTILMIREV